MWSRLWAGSTEDSLLKSCTETLLHELQSEKAGRNHYVTECSGAIKLIQQKEPVSSLCVKGSIDRNFPSKYNHILMELLFTAVGFSLHFLFPSSILSVWSYIYFQEINRLLCVCVCVCYLAERSKQLPSRMKRASCLWHSEVIALWALLIPALPLFQAPGVVVNNKMKTFFV